MEPDDDPGGTDDSNHSSSRFSTPASAGSVNINNPFSILNSPPITSDVGGSQANPFSLEHTFRLCPAIPPDDIAQRNYCSMLYSLGAHPNAGAQR